MGFEGWCRDTFGGAGRTWKTLAAAALIVMLAAATSRAGDVSGQAANSLSVTKSGRRGGGQTSRRRGP